MTGQPLQTEFEFTLPRGYVDEDGTLHKEGRMRLATAADEIQPLKNQRVQSNSSYLTIVLLSRVVTELGSLETIDEQVVQNLFVTDLEYLQSMYERINNRGRNAVETACPDCGTVFDVDAETGTQLRPADGDDGVEMTFDTIGSTTDDSTDGDIEEVEAGNPTE
ncbi:hypothetical protein [Natrinema salifodinae]|uniref:Uncharacterized protein n=1 Tax=Natrinema salifodinae TaxID=1202768 RepID=A0A1I0MIQ7_9EURY|nr:hypothetical protein [Natrinema salifodinae]SEV88179.1 hypothetical protein SAMN05216285_1017 [Natrinema salifodinae]